jgi:hypothetical protein
MTHRIAPLLPLALLLTLAACAAPEDAPPDDAPPAWPRDTWNPSMPTGAALGTPRGFQDRRSVFHLHSPYSHDACDGQGWADGVMDTACEAQLRVALCDAAYDNAFITDHPDYGDAQSFEALFHPQPGDVWYRDDAGKPYALEMACPDGHGPPGHKVQWRAGFEDELMPVSLHDHVDADPEARHDLLNRSDDEAAAAIQAAGGFVLMAHTESKPDDHLARLQDAGLHAVEAFNVHAMFDPDIRSEFLGLDGLGWAYGIGPFTSEDSAAEPDLLFLAVHQEQAISVGRWDMLLARGPMMATAGSDAHQNVLPLELRDGERVDSYRRTLRWFSTHLWARGDAADPARAVDEALAARRAYVAFESLGTPAGLDFRLDGDDGATYEMGSDAPTGTLVVACPTLANGSPRGADEPEISVTVYKDGEPWQSSCGSWPVTSGVYRATFEIVPHHLRPFLGDVADAFIHPYPWIYTGAVRVVR